MSSSIRHRLPFLLAGALALGAVAMPAAAQHRVTIADVQAEEGSGNGTRNVQFLLTLTRDTTATSGGATSVRVRGESGSATVGGSNGSLTSQPSCGGTSPTGADIILQQDVVIFTAAQPNQVVNLTLCGDTFDEADSETFTLRLFDAVGVQLDRLSATGTILDDDSPPSLRVADVTANEGAPATFTITLSAASGREVRFGYTLQNGPGANGAGSATGGATCGAGIDFDNSLPAALVVLPVGQTSVTATVPVCGDAVPEPDESFTLRLVNASNASAGGATAVATARIPNDDPFPVIAILAPADASVSEGTGGATTLRFSATIDRAPAAGAPASAELVASALGGGVIGTTCTGTTDFVIVGGASRVLTWNPGDQSARNVDVTVCGDARDDGDTEQVSFALAEAQAATLGTATAQATVSDDDALPVASILNATVVEPAAVGATSTASVVVRLNTVSNRGVSVLVVTTEQPDAPLSAGLLYSATMGTACDGTADFIRRIDVVTIPAGQLETTASVRICFDGRREGMIVQGASSSPLNANFRANKEVFLTRLSAIAQTLATLGDTDGNVVINDP